MSRDSFRFEEALFDEALRGTPRGGGADFENARRARVREDVPCGTGRSRLRPGPRRRRVCGSRARGRVRAGQDVSVSSKPEIFLFFSLRLNRLDLNFE